MSSVARARRTNRDTRTMEEKGDTETGDKMIQTCKENRGEQDRDRVVQTGRRQDRNKCSRKG